MNEIFKMHAFYLHTGSQSPDDEESKYHYYTYNVTHCAMYISRVAMHVIV